MQSPVYARYGLGIGPPGPFGVTDNGIVDDMTETVVEALNSAC